jgi:hypothetical protein
MDDDEQVNFFPTEKRLVEPQGAQVFDNVLTYLKYRNPAPATLSSYIQNQSRVGSLIF